MVIPAGLRGIVYHLRPGTNRLPDFEKLKPQGSIYASSLNVPAQSFRDGFPGVTRRFEWFAIDYTGRFWIETPGEYRFSLTSDDGARLSIDGRVVVDNDGEHPLREAAGAIDLPRGVHRMRVSYFQGPRFEVALVLKIARPGQDFRIFSTSEFAPPAGASIDADAPVGRIEIDNDFVRVTRATVPPRQKTPEHPLNRVLVYLDRESHRVQAGHVAWSAATSAPFTENTGRSPVRVIEIELKKPEPVESPLRSRELDPVLIDPRHNVLLFENAQVRVFRSWREPGAAERVHEHTGAGRVAVFLTDIDATIRSGDAETPLHANAGEVSWSGPVKHAAINTGARKFEMIVVEVK